MLVVPDDLDRRSEEKEEGGCRVDALAPVLVWGEGEGSCRLPYPVIATLFRGFLGQSPMGDGSLPSSCSD